MAESATESLVPTYVGDEPDFELAGTDDELAKEAGTRVNMRAGSKTDAMQSVDVSEHDEDCPFELSFGQPIAYSATKLWHLTNREVPAEIRALRGNATVPVLVMHRLTPFPRFGYPPTRVWGLGLQIDVDDASASTLDYAPRSEFEKYVDANADVGVELTSGGTFAAHTDALAAMEQIPGVSIDSLGVTAKANTGLKLVIRASMRSLRVQAGAVERGVRWDLHRHSDEMLGEVRFYQTVLVPKDLQQLRIRQSAWVRRRRFFGLAEARVWKTPQREKAISIQA